MNGIMKAGPVNHSKQRSRGRGMGGGGGGSGGGGGGGGGKPRHQQMNVRGQVFDSNGPEGRIRGSANQVMEKYLMLARDASSQGDRVAAENYYQHAEHYFRLLNAYNQSSGQRRPTNSQTPAEDQQPENVEGEDGERGQDRDHGRDQDGQDSQECGDQSAESGDNTQSEPVGA